MFNKTNLYYSVRKIENIIFQRYCRQWHCTSSPELRTNRNFDDLHSNNKLKNNSFLLQNCVRSFSSCSQNQQIKFTPNELRRFLEMERHTKFRSDPVIVTLDTPEFKSIFNKNLHDLLTIFKTHNHEIRIAGGAIRDLLMGLKPIDIDFATTATPQQMIEMFEKENIRIFNRNGEKHGTVTVRLNDEQNFEITSLRIDVSTDGRHAEVEFTTNWLLDASRRDLTINSMFLGFDGKVYDWFYGYDDLKNKRVVFVGNAAKRIQEDYLRILRYFRFYGRISDVADKHDESTIEDIKANITGLQIISGQRIWVELKKILQGNFRIELFIKLLECGAMPYIGFPANEVNLDELRAMKSSLDTSFKNIPINPATILATLLNTIQDANNLNDRLKLSAYERDLAIFLADNKIKTKNINDPLHYKRMCMSSNRRSSKTNTEYTLELLKLNNKRTIYDEISVWEMPKKPINGLILAENGCPPGRTMKIVLTRLVDIWSKNNFSMGKDELLTFLPEVLNQVTHENTLQKNAKSKK